MNFDGDFIELGTQTLIIANRDAILKVCQRLNADKVKSLSIVATGVFAQQHTEEFLLLRANM